MKMPIVNRQKKTITVSKEFMINAGQFDTQEFDILNEMQQTHPGYEIQIHTIARNPNKRDYGDLTYDNMRKYIEGYEDSTDLVDALAEFEAVQKVAKTMRGTYALVKKWFLEKYGDEFKRFQDAQKAKKAAEHDTHLLYNPDED